MLQGKVWGSTRLLLKTPLIEVHEIKINPNSHCSMHKHRHKWNGFYVVDGRIEVIVEKSDYKLTDTTILEIGEFTTVEPNEYHCFRTGDVPATVIEVYYPEVLSEDIVRKTVGGINA